VELDGWVPTVQGAFGHVFGVRGADDGSRYVVKTYPPQEAVRAATELLALNRLAELPDVPVPAVVHCGELTGPEPVPYLLLPRLPGLRWADRWAVLPPARAAALTVAVGRLLRRMHGLTGERFGDLLPEGASWSSPWQRVDARCDELVRHDLQRGGSPVLTGRVRDLVDSSRLALDSCRRPVLCHNDFVGSNILVATGPDPDILGVVDLERASWDDPLCDLARTRLHVRYHDQAGADVVTRAYGVEGDAEHRRLDVHEVLHALQERTWIASDRPAGWQRSVAALETFLRRRTEPTGPAGDGACLLLQRET
jgi:aminoglycoside phosphotransferase (APT) family kinase protein